MEKLTEFDFLLQCLRLDPGPVETPFLPAGALDWETWQKLLIAHGVYPQVYRQIKINSPAVIPASVLDDLHRGVLNQTGLNMRLCRELLQLSQDFEMAGIQALPFKGPVLSLQAYDDCFYRVYRDIDVLVFRSDFPRLYELMADRGYRPVLKLTKSQATAWARAGQEFVFSKGDMIMDVHFGLLRGLRWQGFADRAWGEYTRLPLLDGEVPSFSLPGAALSVCINGMRDGWNRLGQVLDLAALVKNPRLDRGALASMAREMGVSTGLRVGLALAREFLGLAIPGDLAVSPRLGARAERLARRCANQLRSGSGRLDKSFNRWIYFRSLDRFSVVARSLRRELTAPKASDVKLVSLPGRLFFLYGFLRPWLLLGRGLKRFFSKGVSLCL